jgi:hypothetical protein
VKYPFLILLNIMLHVIIVIVYHVIGPRMEERSLNMSLGYTMISLMQKTIKGISSCMFLLYSFHFLEAWSLRQKMKHSHS